MNTALIFIFTDSIDAYLNAILHLSDKHEVTRFTFVFLTGTTMEGPSTDFADKIVSSLEDLSIGRHQGRSIDLDSKAKARCATIAADLQASQALKKTIPLVELGRFLEEQSRQVKPNRMFIDVTGLPKVLMSRVMLIGIASGYEVYAFELHKKPNRNRPDRSLYFAIPPGEFTYYSLTQDPAVQASFRQLIPVRKVLRMLIAISLIGIICFSILTFIDPQNPLFTIIGLAASFIGIISGIHQVHATQSAR